jgi:anti-sigma regulatory factor (Ser/Thr protein kinase)
MNDPDWSHQTTLVATPVSAPRARAFVCRHLIEHGVAYLADPVRLVVSELATNAIVHAPSSFTVTLSCIDRTVRLVVRDDSPVRPESSMRRTDLSGRGRTLVQLVSSDWGIDSDEPGSHTVWASFDLRPTSSAEPSSIRSGAPQLEHSQH